MALGYHLNLCKPSVLMCNSDQLPTVTYVETSSASRYITACIPWVLMGTCTSTKYIIVTDYKYTVYGNFQMLYYILTGKQWTCFHKCFLQIYSRLASMTLY